MHCYVFVQTSFNLAVSVYSTDIETIRGSVGHLPRVKVVRGDPDRPGRSLVKFTGEASMADVKPVKDIIETL